LNAITLGESSPEKAGVGGSIPSLATTLTPEIFNTYWTVDQRHRKSRKKIRRRWPDVIDRRDLDPGVVIASHGGRFCDDAVVSPEEF
jgi:hypothetical protein